MRYNWIVVLIVVAGLAAKLAGAFLLPVFHDVGWYRALALFHDSAYMNLIQLEHPPLGYYFFLFGLKLFGIHNYVVRLVPFVFNVIELCLVYWLTRKWYGNRVANAALILWSLTFFSYVNALSPEVDGSIMSVFSIFLFYFFYYFFKTGQKKYLLLTGIFYGLLMLIKVRGVLFIIPLTLYALYKTRNLRKLFWLIGPISLLGLVIFLLFPLVVYMANPAEFAQLMKQVIVHNTGKVSLMYKFTHPLIFLQVVVVLSPLYLFLLWTGLKGKWSDVDVLLLIWFSTLFVVLLALLPVGGLAAVYPRYISFLLPPLLMLSAKGLASFRYNKRNVLIVLAAASLLYWISHWINEVANDYWFYASAAIGVYKLTQPLLVFYLFTPFVLWFLYGVLKQKAYKTAALAVFLVITLAFNIHFIMEPVVDQTHPKIIKELTTFFCKHSIKKPLFVWAEDLAFYLGSNGLNIKTFTNPQLKSYAERLGYSDQGHFYFDLNDPIAMGELELRGGTVFTLYMPYKYALQKDPNRQKEDAFLRENCTLLKSAVYKTGRGEVWEC